MSWSNYIETALVIVVAIVAVAGSAAGFAILLQILRQGAWKLAEPSVRKARWQIVRPWLVAGAGVGLLFGIAIVFVSSMDETPPAVPNDVINSPPIELKFQPRDGGEPTE